MSELFELCRLSEIPVNNAKGFTATTSRGKLELFLVRTNDDTYAYINSCPHTGVYLDWTPDQFLDASGESIQCATHGARFRIADGFCTWGPCSGESLAPVKLLIEGDTIHLIMEN